MRVMENILDKDKQIASQRGNISYTTINLARIGIRNTDKEEKLDKFYEELEEELNLVKEQLLDRFETQGNKRVLNFHFCKTRNLARFRKSKR